MNLICQQLKGNKMFYLIGKKKNSQEKVLIDKIPDDFAQAHDAAYCGQYWPDYTDFELVKADSDNEQK